MLLKHHSHPSHHPYTHWNSCPHATQLVSPAHVLHTVSLLNHSLFILSHLPLFFPTFFHNSSNRDYGGLSHYDVSSCLRKSQSLGVFKDYHQMSIKKKKKKIKPRKDTHSVLHSKGVYFFSPVWPICSAQTLSDQEYLQRRSPPFQNHRSFQVPSLYIFPFSKIFWA